MMRTVNNRNAIDSAILAVALILSAVTASAQTVQDDRLAVVRRMVDGYNRQDYAALKHPWATVGKMIVTRKKLRSELEPVFRRHGHAMIDTIIYSEYTYVAKLRLEKSPKERLYLQFIFNEKAKLEGFGFSYPPFIYRRRAVPKSLDEAAFSKDVDSLMARRYLKNETQPFNGSVMVLDGGKPVYKRHFGYADFTKKAELNDSTMFELASCSKQFTAMAVLMLAKEGRLRLDDSLQRFIPGFPYHGITIHHLLTHTSGLPDYERLLDKVWDKTKFATNGNVIAVLAQHRPNIHFKPGERFEYSNTGYVLLSVIIARASGKSYAEYLASTIFLPLGMNHTRVYNTRRSGGEIIDNYAYGYVYSGAQKKYLLPDSMNRYRRVIYQDAVTGDGTVNSCLVDLLKWERELLEPRILDADLIRQATADHTTNAGKAIDYGYGFLVRGDGTSVERIAMHTGGWPGYTCVLVNFFDQRKQIVILSNNAYDNFTRIADAIALMLVED